MKLTRLVFVAIAGMAVFAITSISAGSGGPVADFPFWMGFNPDQSPEGVAVDKFGNVFLSMSVGIGESQHDEIWKFTPSGEQSVLATFDPPAGRVGLAVDAPGNVYFARSLPAAPGVWRVNQDGQVMLLPGTQQILFADGLAFDQRGNLYVTDMTSFENEIPACSPSGEGRIWRVPKNGAAEIWLRNPLLNGDCSGYLGIAVGANGIQFYNGDLYVISTEKGIIVRVPVLPDGSPGPATVWATIQPAPESPFPPIAMGDGFALDVHGNAYIANVAQSAVVRINADDFSQETIAAAPYAPLDTPTSIAFGTGKGGRTSIFITNMGWMTSFGVPNAPGPGLMKIDVGIPGLPLP